MTLLRALRRLPPLETGLLVLGIVVLVILGAARQTQEQSGPQIDSFSTYDAQTGGYRAFYAMLEAEGVRVTRFQSRPAFLDASIDTLVYVEPYTFDERAIQPTEADVHDLETWVRAGGRLLYIGHDDAAARAGYLHLPRSRKASRIAGPVVRAPDIARDGVDRLIASTNLRFTHLPAHARVLYDDGRGPFAVAYPFGRGSVTTLIDEDLLENANLGKGDAARFGYALASPARPNGAVAFDETPHGYLIAERWYTIVPRAFAIALAIAVGVILIALAGAAVRLGPALVPFERRDRSSADFIDALSTLLERGRATRKALVDASNSTARAIARANGLGDDASDAEIAAKIENAESRDSYRTMRLVAANGFADEKNLLRGVALAQQLRKEFAPHGRPRN